MTEYMPPNTTEHDAPGEAEKSAKNTPRGVLKVFMLEPRIFFLGGGVYMSGGEYKGVHGLLTGSGSVGGYL